MQKNKTLLNSGQVIESNLMGREFLHSFIDKRALGPFAPCIFPAMLGHSGSAGLNGVISVSTELERG